MGAGGRYLDGFAFESTSALSAGAARRRAQGWKNGRGLWGQPLVFTRRKYLVTKGLSTLILIPDFFLFSQRTGPSVSYGVPPMITGLILQNRARGTSIPTVFRRHANAELLDLSLDLRASLESLHCFEKSLPRVVPFLLFRCFFLFCLFVPIPIFRLPPFLSRDCRTSLFHEASIPGVAERLLDFDGRIPTHFVSFFFFLLSSFLRLGCLRDNGKVGYPGKKKDRKRRKIDSRLIPIYLSNSPKNCSYEIFRLSWWIYCFQSKQNSANTVF